MEQKANYFRLTIGFLRDYWSVLSEEIHIFMRAFKLILILLFASCGGNSESNTESEKDQKKELQNEKINSLAEKHNAIQDWEVNEFIYVIEYQNFFAENNKPILVRALISDIYKKDDKNYVIGEIIGVSRLRQFYYTAICSEDIVDKLLGFSNKQYLFAALIIKPNQLLPLKLKLDVDVEIEAEEGYPSQYDISSDIIFSSTYDIYMYGTLLDFEML